MVFEKLGDNLLTLIKRFNYRGLPLRHVKALTHQMLARAPPPPPAAPSAGAWGRERPDAEARERMAAA